MLPYQESTAYLGRQGPRIDLKLSEATAQAGAARSHAIDARTGANNFPCGVALFGGFVVQPKRWARRNAKTGVDIDFTDAQSNTSRSTPISIQQTDWSQR